MSDLIYLKGSPKELKAIIMHIMAMHQLLESKDLGTIYADPSASPPIRRRGKPKIVLYFLEKRQFKSNRGSRHGTISFRLMNETPASFTEANQKALALQIKNIFGANGGLSWEKGKDLYTYTDWDLGYQLQLLCRSSSVAKNLVTKTLSIQNHTPDWKRLNHTEADQPLAKYPVLPSPRQVAGKTIQPLEERPVVDVIFRNAYAIVEGLPEPIDLYGRSRRGITSLS